ncbi:MAG: phage tail tube protein [Erysipelothrix sp.]
MDFLELAQIPLCTEGAGFITIGGQNRKLFDLSKLEANVELKVWEKRPLGARMMQSRVTGGAGTGNLSVYNMTSDFFDAFEKYKKSGVFPGITIQAYNDDPASEIGRSEYLLTKVVLKKIPLIHLEENKDETDPVDIDFNFGGVEGIEKFNKPTDY